MIDPKELRLGNIVYCNIDGTDRECYVDSIARTTGGQNNLAVTPLVSPTEKGTYSTFGNINVYGVPITEDWLKGFGFEWEEDCGVYYWLIPYKIGLTKDFFLSERKDLKVEYVHQLQNLFFSLTGKELERSNT